MSDKLQILIIEDDIEYVEIVKMCLDEPDSRPPDIAPLVFCPLFLIRPSSRDPEPQFQLRPGEARVDPIERLAQGRDSPAPVS